MKTKLLLAFKSQPGNHQEKSRPKTTRRAWFAALMWFSTMNPQLSTLFAQGTAFTYQGRFNTNSAPYTGSAEFQFTLWDAVSGGNAVATNNPVAGFANVTDGLFTAMLDFGSNPFSGQPRFLQIEARTTIGAFTTLTPRQPLTPTPYALRALHLTTNGLAAGAYNNAVSFNNAGNNFSGSGAGLTAVNAAMLDGLSSARFWQLGGNAGANPTNGNFLGTTDNLPLEIKVNGRRALRFEPNTNGAPNVIGGSQNNYVSNSVVGATISGGGATNNNGNSYTNSVTANFGTVSGGAGNTASRSATVGGGYDNAASNDYAAVAGGAGNTAGYAATVSGGLGNTASVDAATVGGGAGNTAGGSYATVGGGGNNTASNFYATVSGGYNNTAGGSFSFAAGRQAKANHTGAFVWADSTSADFASTGNNQFLIRASGGVGIGIETPNSQLHVNGDGVAPSLRVQVAGSSKLVVAANGGTAVGAVVTPPANGLYVSGDVGIGRTPTANALEVDGTASKTTAGSWLANSDARIKNALEPVTGALATLNKVRLVSFRYTDDYRAQHKGIDDRRYLNVVAQEFREVFPEHVKSSGEKLADGSEILQVDIHPLTIYSAAAIQELNQRLEAGSRRAEDRGRKLEERLQQKETEITEMKQRLEKLEQLLAPKLAGGAK